MAGRRTRLHALLTAPGIHLLLQRDTAGTDLPTGPHITALRLPETGRGLTLTRPDGYVGLRCADADLPQLRAWLSLVDVWPQG
jgi:hypothetical protein